MWSVLSNLKPDEWKQLIVESRVARRKRSVRMIASWSKSTQICYQSCLPFRWCQRVSDSIETMMHQIIGKGRITYLLKKSASKHNSRKGPRVYTANLGMLKDKDNEEEKESEHRSHQEYNEEINDAMKIDLPRLHSHRDRS